LPNLPVSIDPDNAQQRLPNGDPVDPNAPADPNAPTTTTTGTPGTPGTPPPPAAATPGAPLGVLATAGESMAKVSWTAAAPNGSPVTGYVVTDAVHGVHQQVAGTVLEATLTGLTNDTTYTFSVHATNAIGDGPATAALPVTPAVQLPGVPSGFQASLVKQSSSARDDYVASLTWSAPTTNAAVVGHYEAVCALPSASTTTPTIVAAGGSGPYTTTFPALTPGTGYSCWVRAVDGSNRPGPRASMAPGTLITPWGSPDATNIATGSIGYTTCDVTWTAPAFNGGRALTEYRIVLERWASSTTWAPMGTTVVPAGGATATTLTGLQHSWDYRFVIVSVNRDPATGDTTSSTSGYVSFSTPIFIS
jgi:hypothetical protein